MARQVFNRFKALLMEPAVFAYAERHDNIEAIYKKLGERRDTANVTELLKELHRIVNQALIPTLDHFTEKEYTQAEVQTSITDFLYENFPSPLFSDEEMQAIAESVYGFVWQQSLGGRFVGRQSGPDSPRA